MRSRRSGGKSFVFGPTSGATHHDLMCELDDDAQAAARSVYCYPDVRALFVVRL